MKTFILYITIIILFISSSIKAQTTVSINPSQDNTLFEDANGGLSDGAGDHFYVGKTNSNKTRRGLIKFNVASSIPSGALITSVSLSLTMDKSISGASNVSLYKLSTDWGEGSSFSSGGGASATQNDATWLNTFYPGSYWTTPGGDFSSTISASTSVNSTGVYTWSSPQMVADAQNWLNTTSTNFGWCLVGDESTYPTTKRFVSKESSSTSDIPVLVVTYIPNAVILNPLKDNTLFESTTGSLSNGAGDHFFVGKTSSNLKRRGLVMFDVASSVPAGAVITSVSLSLTMDQSVSGASNVELHKASADWGEGASFSSGGGAQSQTNDATWIHRFYPGSLWTTPGGDFSSTISASTSVSGNGVYQWTSAQMIADVQSWLNTPGSNFGWCIKGNETISQTAKRFVTKESSNTNSWPSLLITYTIPACVNTANSFSVTSYVNYTSPAGNVYTSSQIINETIPNAAGCDSNLTINLTIIPPKIIHLHTKLQALYQSTGLMSQAMDYDDNIGDFAPKFASPIVDTLSVLIRSSIAPDYTILNEFHGLNLNNDGSITDFTLVTNLTGTNYIVINHRNSLETWSDAITFSTQNINYNFYTHPVSAIFAGNMQDTYTNTGVYIGSLIWSGDIIKDGVINIYDLSDVFDNINNPNSPNGYQVDDINSDGVVNIYDLSLVFDNINLGIGSVNPFTLK